MAKLRVTCTCGAIYEMIESKGFSKDPRPSKCVLCDREVFPPDRETVGQLHLVWRPDEDRESCDLRAAFVDTCSKAHRDILRMKARLFCQSLASGFAVSRGSC
jgi:hypothetical protein